ncbi:MAG TPA: DUF3108 domain-containing protein [Thermoanaerobaculia bacterium]
MNLILSTVLVAMAAATSPAPQPFGEGETLDYTLSWMRMTGGTARMTISPLPGDPARFRITSVARSSPGFSRIYKVRDEIETTVAQTDFSTVRYVKKLNERERAREETTVIEGGVATRVRKGVTTKLEVPRPIFDPISVIYYLRTLDLSVGKVHDLTLFDGKIYRLRAHVVRRETIQTPAGRFATVMVEPEMLGDGEAREERLFVWYTDDERRIPVRIRTEIKVGAVTASLSRISTGVESTEPSPLR